MDVDEDLGQNFDLYLGSNKIILGPSLYIASPNTSVLHLRKSDKYRYLDNLFYAHLTSILYIGRVVGLHETIYGPAQEYL